MTATIKEWKIFSVFYNCVLFLKQSAHVREDGFNISY